MRQFFLRWKHQCHDRCHRALRPSAFCVAPAGLSLSSQRVRLKLSTSTRVHAAKLSGSSFFSVLSLPRHDSRPPSDSISISIIIISARSAASYEDSRGRSIVALQKLSLKHDRNPGARWGANRLLARAQNPSSSEGGDGSRSGGSQEERERARLGAHTRTWRRRSWRHSQSRRGSAQASADDIHGARSGEAGNSGVLKTREGARQCRTKGSR